MKLPRCLLAASLSLLATRGAIAADIPVPATLTPGAIQAWEHVNVLPSDRQGRFPLEMPKYEGVKQLLLLSSRWVVVVTVNLDDVFAQVDKLSKGEFQKMVNRWDACDKAHPDWVAYKGRGQIRDEHWAEARELAGERKLDEPGTYSIGGDDPAYTKPLTPKRVTRMIVGLGGQTSPDAARALHGAGGVYYAHYSYLEMPSPLQPGRTYTIALADGRKVTFVYDETRTVSRAIKVNQAGYLPDAEGKYAYLGAWLGEFGPHDFHFATNFLVVAVDSGEVVFRGPVRLREANPRVAPRPGKGDKPEDRPLYCGEDVYEMDLSGLKREGWFFITVPGVGRSWAFRHGRDAYGEAFYTACRGLYNQRCGTAIGPPFSAWSRPMCHTNPVYECEHVPWSPGADFQRPAKYEIFDVVGGTINTRFKPADFAPPPKAPGEGAPATAANEEGDTAELLGGPTARPAPAPRKTEHVTGGWHDAADWDRGIYHYSCILDLLNAFELAPRKFHDGQLNIPESGNGIPDILDEAEYGLRVWKLSMDDAGGVSGMVETWTHPAMDDPNIQYAFSRRTRWSSLLFAAAAAQYAHLVKPYDGARSADYEAAAKRAYTFGNDPRRSLGKVAIHARKNRGDGTPYTIQWEEKDAMVRPFLAYARLRLAILTGDRTFLDPVPELTREVLMPYQWPDTYKDFSPWMVVDIPRAFAKDLPADTVGRWRNFFMETGTNLAALNASIPYRCSWPQYQDYWMGWGASDMANYGRALFIAWSLSGRHELRDAAIQNMDFMLGANPMGMSWTTGLGYSYPIDIQHAISENDGILDPVPGITIYGVTGGVYPLLRNMAWRAPKADAPGGYVDFVKPANREQPVWRQWSCHPHENAGQCEFTIHETMAATLFNCAMLLPDDWMPSAELKARGPRADEALFGYYYLP